MGESRTSAAATAASWREPTAPWVSIRMISYWAKGGRLRRCLRRTRPVDGVADPVAELAIRIVGIDEIEAVDRGRADHVLAGRLDHQLGEAARSAVSERKKAGEGRLRIGVDEEDGLAEIGGQRGLADAALGAGDADGHGALLRHVTRGWSPRTMNDPKEVKRGHRLKGVGAGDRI
jgi:hypothetical protein